jgi:hypothetical protein
VVARKWPDRPHWEFDGVLLGADEHGHWVGAPPGTPMRRPGASFVTGWRQVSVFPRSSGFVATFYSPPGSAPCETYVDITTVPVWDDDSVTAVDLDLDVVRGWSGRVWVDDEDEFADHRVRWAYPDDLVLGATGSCAAVQEAMAAGRPPYDGLTPGPWFDVLEASMMER